MERSKDNPITLLLRRWQQGDAAAATDLFPLIYGELRRLASSYLRRERDLSICRTELVHELYLKLYKHPPDCEDRSHFFGIAARLMRQILVDLAREQKRLKRRAEPATVNFGTGIQPGTADVLALDECLNRLVVLDARKAQIVELRSFGGLTVEEIAAAMELSTATIKREWSVARLWLRRELDTPKEIGDSRPGDSRGLA